MRRVLEIIGITAGVMVVIAVPTVIVTLTTPVSEADVRQWFQAAGGVVSAAAAVVVAVLGFRAQQIQAQQAAIEQRHQAAEAAESARLANQEAFKNASELERQRYENQQRLQVERAELSRQQEERHSFLRARRSAYGDILSWAWGKINNPEESVAVPPYDHGESVWLVSNEVKEALEAFERTHRRDEYQRLVELIRAEVDADSGGRSSEETASRNAELTTPSEANSQAAVDGG